MKPQRLARVGSWQWDRQTETVVWSEELYRIAGRDPSSPAVSYEKQSMLYPGESWTGCGAPSKPPSRPARPTTLVLKFRRLAEGAMARKTNGDRGQATKSPSAVTARPL